MKTLDFVTDENGQPIIENGRFKEETTGASIIKNALLTNARVGNEGGYWLNRIGSKLWRLEQSRYERSSGGVFSEIEVYINEVINNLRETGAFATLEYEIQQKEKSKTSVVITYSMVDTGAKEQTTVTI